MRQSAPQAAPRLEANIKSQAPNFKLMRISGITIPNKRAVFALTALYGIGPSRSAAILKKAKIDSQKKADELTAEEENSIRKQLEGLKLEGDLKREVSG